MISFAKLLYRSPARDWVLLFLAIQCLVNVDGFINPLSRWATMVAMAEDRGPRIDNYVQHTIDWARTPDGHYYSNKAPGPALLAFPFFLIMDKALTAGAHTRPERDEIRVKHRGGVLHLLSLITQAIPYALVVLLMVSALEQMEVSLLGQHLTAVALLFGNTAGLFMNTFFGHGMAAMFVLATVLAWHRRWWFRIGLFFGLGMLTDYGVICLIPSVLYLLVRSKPRRFGNYLLTVLGALAPAAGWIAYHTYCFGGVLALPNKFQNPSFVDLGRDVPSLWGVIRFLPTSHALFELLVGPSRGLIYTQGWILVCLVALVPSRFLRRTVSETETQRDFMMAVGICATLGLGLLLWMNASFGAWHGGATPGPRYLVPGLPIFALTIGGVLQRVPRAFRQLFLVALCLSIFIFILFFSAASIFAQPGVSLLGFYLSDLSLPGQVSGRERLVFISAGFFWVGLRAWQSLYRGISAEISIQPCRRDGV